MSSQEIDNWMNNVFAHPVPKDYLDFLKSGDVSSIEYLYYVIEDMDYVVQISEWFYFDMIPEIYQYCCSEGLLEKCYLPVFDSCACTVAINCDPMTDTYGQVFIRTPEGYYDEDKQRNVYTEFYFTAKSFSDIINNLQTAEELEAKGLL